VVVGYEDYCRAIASKPKLTVEDALAHEALVARRNFIYREAVRFLELAVAERLQGDPVKP
jgi:hypothetical protein